MEFDEYLSISIAFLIQLWKQTEIFQSISPTICIFSLGL